MRLLNDLYDLRFGGCGLTRPAAAAWLGVSVRTLLNHERAPQVVRGPIYRALRLRAGYLEDIAPAWRGWRLVGDRLFWPGDRYGLSAGQIMAMRFELQRLAHLERQLREQRVAETIALPETEIAEEMHGQIVPFLPALRGGNGR